MLKNKYKRFYFTTKGRYMNGTVSWDFEGQTYCRYGWISTDPIRFYSYKRIYILKMKSLAPLLHDPQEGRKAAGAEISIPATLIYSYIRFKYMNQRLFLPPQHADWHSSPQQSSSLGGRENRQKRECLRAVQIAGERGVSANPHVGVAPFCQHHIPRSHATWSKQGC